MGSPVRSLSIIAQNKSSRLIHTLKHIEPHSTINTPIEHPVKGRTFAYSSTQGYDHSNKTVDNEVKTKVNEWSNCLRATLLSNLSPYHAARSKCISTNSGNNEMNRFYPPSMDEYGQSSYQECNKNESYDRDEHTMYFSSVPPNNRTTIVPSSEIGNNWATSLQKTADLNIDDIGTTKASDEQKNLSMDINVVVKIKPHENENKIGFQEINHIEKQDSNDQNISNVASSSEIKENGLAGTLYNMDSNVQPHYMDQFNSFNEEGSYVGSSPIEVREEQGDMISQNMLIEELGEVYSSYKNQKDISAGEINDTDPDAVLRSVNKVKNMYLESLNSLDSSNSTTSGPSNFYDPSINSHLEVTGPERCNARAFLPNNFLKRRSEIGPIRMFSTSSVRQDKKDDCNKVKKLPCLQASELSNAKADLSSGKGTCEKFCMPCCKPARDPPECFYPYNKPPCNRQKPPRPAFSECKQLFPLQMVQPCECIRGIGASCKKSKDSAKCSK